MEEQHSFIYVDEQSLEIKILPEAMMLKELDDLYKSDHSPAKESWKKWIKYIYFVYKKDGVFSGDLLAEKRKEVCIRFFPDRAPDYFESNPKIRAVSKLFVNKQFTHWEKLYEKWKEDVDSFIQYLVDVPYTRKIKGDAEGSPELTIPNIDEKVKAQKAIRDLVDTGKGIESMIYQEKKDKAGGKLNPLFDV